jgi:hypothetical protein
MTSKSVLTGNSTILPTEVQSARLIGVMAGLGYSLYRTASERLGMKLAAIR